MTGDTLWWNSWRATVRRSLRSWRINRSRASSAARLSGACSANFVLLQRTGGTTTLLGSFVHACRDGMVMRLAVHGNVAMVWADEASPAEFQITPGAGGGPGVGTSGAPNGNKITQVQL